MNQTDLLQYERDLDIGNRAKLLSIFTLGLGSFLAGLLPRAISLRNRVRFPFLISLMLCFGAGVLLATALVHMLPDVRKDMPKNAEIYMCFGFFIIYFIDEFIHYFFGEAIQHSHENVSHSHRNTANSESRNSITTIPHANYGATSHSNSETESLLSNENNRQNHLHCHNRLSHQITNNEGSNCEEADAANARICHTSHQEPCSQSMTGALGLLVALSLHSLIEGLAIGVQDNKSEVLLLLAAVSCHKYVMGFCLGLEICSSSNSSLKSHIIAIFVFSLGSVVGIGVGMALVELPATLKQTTLPILQALAGGTLLYVTVCEVMPREKARWHQIFAKRYAGLTQFLAVSCGFIVMVVINYYLDDD